MKDCILERTAEYLQFPERFHVKERQQMRKRLPGKQGYGRFAFFTESAPCACQLFSALFSFLFCALSFSCIDSRKNILYLKILNRGDVELPRPRRVMAGHEVDIKVI